MSEEREEQWRELLPALINLADFTLVSGEHRILGNDIILDGAPTYTFIASGAEITAKLINPSNGMELTIKYIDTNAPVKKVTHPKKLLL